MEHKSIGFIGGGRITKIFLTAFNSAGMDLSGIIVNDQNDEVLEKRKAQFPAIITTQDVQTAANKDIVFISLHPPMISDILKLIKPVINENTILISLAPKYEIKDFQNNLDSLKNVARSIPNSPSIIQKGYNPICFSAEFNPAGKLYVEKLFSFLGEYFIADESSLETYALITAMGPTYIQFQFNKLFELAVKFGLDVHEAKNAVKNMVSATNNLLFDSTLSYDEITDLIPVKPIKDHEEEILSIYDNNLEALWKKLKNKD